MEYYIAFTRALTKPDLTVYLLVKRAALRAMRIVNCVETYLRLKSRGTLVGD